jgi:hypothetical protein
MRTLPGHIERNFRRTFDPPRLRFAAIVDEVVGAACVVRDTVRTVRVLRSMTKALTSAELQSAAEATPCYAVHFGHFFQTR